MISTRTYHGLGVPFRAGSLYPDSDDGALRVARYRQPRRVRCNDRGHSC